MRPIPVRAQEEIIQAGRRMDSRGWVPATAGNLSVRLDDRAIAITRSGGHKGFLDAFSIIEVDLDGRPANPGDKPSAETLLHCQIYRAMPEIGAVLHGHSVPGTVLTMADPARAIRLAGYEVQKAFPGQTTHDAAITLPVFDNDQDMRRLAAIVAPHLTPAPSAANTSLPGYYIRGHGIYVWGTAMASALNTLEAVEFLLACELERRKLRAGAAVNQEQSA